jgi:hypothetical protein
MKNISKIIPLEHKMIVEETERYVEIYKLTCTVSGKSYVGQAVSHILNSGKYRRYGMKKRFDCHVSETFSKKKNQCHYLNNSIKKYGKESFNLELLDRCSLSDADKTEEFYIKKYNTMFPKGYNLKFGTVTTYLSLEGRKRVSNGVYEYYKDKKFERFKDLSKPLTKNIDDYIRPLNREGIQYGWYVYIGGKKADFGGKHISLDISRKRAEEFIIELNEYIAKHLIMTGSPLEP